MTPLDLTKNNGKNQPFREFADSFREFADSFREFASSFREDERDREGASGMPNIW
jgi:hypothetical protein